MSFEPFVDFIINNYTYITFSLLLLIPVVLFLAFGLMYVLAKLSKNIQTEINNILQSVQKITEYQSLLNKTFLEEMSRNRVELLTNITNTLNSLSATQLEQLKIFS